MPTYWTDKQLFDMLVDYDLFYTVQIKSHFVSMFVHKRDNTCVMTYRVNNDQHHVLQTIAPPKGGYADPPKLK